MLHIRGYKAGDRLACEVQTVPEDVEYMFVYCFTPVSQLVIQHLVPKTNIRNIPDREENSREPQGRLGLDFIH
jgi:hypothetical protein